MAVNYLLNTNRVSIRRMAELGTFTGHTANLLADLSDSDTRIEIYDLFQHNSASKQALANHPHFDEDSFFPIWKHNTRRNRQKFELYRGDLNDTFHLSGERLDFLFVDIVKHASIVNTVVDFYNRMNVGGFLCHQDYYHWQSPWLVYQMELLDDAFVLLGDFGNNMTVYVKTRELTDSEAEFDYVSGLSPQEKYDLFDRAIARHPGIRAGNLMASKLRLSLSDPSFDSKLLATQIRVEFSTNMRINGYVTAIMNLGDDFFEMKW